MCVCAHASMHSNIPPKPLSPISCGNSSGWERKIYQNGLGYLLFLLLNPRSAGAFHRDFTISFKSLVH